VRPSITQNSGPGGKSTRCDEPRSQLFEPELVHASFAALVPFTVTRQQRSAVFVDVGLIQRQRLRDPKSTTPQNCD
jgi:hypothetical protein